MIQKLPFSFWVSKKLKYNYSGQQKHNAWFHNHIKFSKESNSFLFTPCKFYESTLDCFIQKAGAYIFIVLLLSQWELQNLDWFYLHFNYTMESTTMKGWCTQEPTHSDYHSQSKKTHQSLLFQKLFLLKLYIDRRFNNNNNNF